MSVTLGGVDVTGLVLNSNFDLGINSVAEPALDGSIIIYEQDKLYSEVSLVGGVDWGWLTKGTLEELRVNAMVKGAVYVLNYEGVDFTVRYMTESIPVISAEPLINRSNIEDSDYYNNVTIQLMKL